MVSDHLWSIGGAPWLGNSYSNQAYEYERGTSAYAGNKTTWRGKIAIMYISDYGYGTDFRECSQTLANMGNDACKGTDWLNLNVAWNATVWYLSHNYSNSVDNWTTIGGRLNLAAGTGTRVNGASRVFPTLYLDPNITAISGDGTRTNPYILSL